MLQREVEVGDPVARMVSTRRSLSEEGYRYKRRTRSTNLRGGLDKLDDARGVWSGSLAAPRSRP